MTIYAGYNGGKNGTINLSDLPSKPFSFDQCTFVKYDWESLSGINTTSTNFLNLGIRSQTANREDAVEDMQVAFNHEGFNTAYHPPARDTNGIWLDGRTRILAAIANGETHIPVAIYKRRDTSTYNTIVNGILANASHATAKRATYADFVNGGIQLIASKQLAATNKKDIRDYLDKAGISKLYDPTNIFQHRSVITKMVNEIVEKSKKKKSLTVCRTRGDWEKWLETNVGLQKGDYHLQNVDSDTYCYRFICEQLLPRAREYNQANKTYKPLQMVFFSNRETASQARHNLHHFISKLDELYKALYAVPEVLHGTKFTKQPLFTILGAVPQIHGKHCINGKTLVAINKY